MGCQKEDEGLGGGSAAVVGLREKCGHGITRKDTELFNAKKGTLPISFRVLLCDSMATNIVKKMTRRLVACVTRMLLIHPAYFENARKDGANTDVTFDDDSNLHLTRYTLHLTHYAIFV
jgi:hypothetical protein